MSTGIEVRAARPGDAPSVRTLAEGFTASAAEVPVEDFTRRFLRCLDSDAFALPVAVIDARLVGYALAQDFGPGLRSTFTTGRLHDLYVDPSARRGGAGRALVDWVFDWARNRPEAMILDWQSTPGGVAFYESLGFTPDRVGDHADFPGFSLDLRG